MLYEVITMSKVFLALIIGLLPWPIKRYILIRFYKFEIHDKARIGFSLIMVKRMSLASGARIGSFTLIKGLDSLYIGESSRIGNFNWITSYNFV